MSVFLCEINFFASYFNKYEKIKLLLITYPIAIINNLRANYFLSFNIFKFDGKYLSVKIPPTLNIYRIFFPLKLFYKNFLGILVR